MSRYRKKPAVIEAEQFYPTRMPWPDGVEQYDAERSEHVWRIQTLEGPMEVRPGDMIITGVHGERYPCKPDIFDATYEPIPRRRGGVMLPTLQYAWLTCRHKWFVFLAGLKLGCPIWRLLTHDLSKFRPSELPHYGRQFFGAADDPAGFIQCWTRHQNRNDHHWEYWIPRTGHNRCTPAFPDGEPIEMPEVAVREMVADWMGASRAYEGVWPGRTWPWLDKNQHKMRLHILTKHRVAQVLDERAKEAGNATSDS